MRTGLVLMTLWTLWAGAALAETSALTLRIERELRQQGFSQLRVTTTWLGRTRIEATGPAARREIVLNPNTGEILRDYTTTLSGAPQEDILQNADRSGSGGGDSGHDSGEGGSGGSGSGGSGSSGSGSGDSGSGGSGSSGGSGDHSGSDGGDHSGEGGHGSD